MGAHLQLWVSGVDSAGVRCYQIAHWKSPTSMVILGSKNAKTPCLATKKPSFFFFGQFPEPQQHVESYNSELDTIHYTVWFGTEIHLGQHTVQGYPRTQGLVSDFVSWWKAKFKSWSKAVSSWKVFNLFYDVVDCISSWNETDPMGAVVLMLEYRNTLQSYLSSENCTGSRMYIGGTRLVSAI